MSRIKDKGSISGNDFYLMRRGQSVIAQRQQIDEGELCSFLDRPSFQAIARIAAEKYFHQVTCLEVFPAVCELFTHLNVLAPITQCLPYSYKLEWTTGHVLSWIRSNCNSLVQRYYFSVETIPRTFNPTLLKENLELLGIHDSAYVELLVEQYKRHYGGPHLRSDLAHRIFDPIILFNQASGYRLRVGNTVYRLEKVPIPGCIDLRVKQGTVLGAFRIRFVHKKAGNYLEIILCHDATEKFKADICSILDSSASPKHKLYVINDRISDFLQTMRYARSAWLQAKDLQNWLVQVLRPLYGSLPSAVRREKGFRAEFLSSRQDSLSLPMPNFFWNPKQFTLAEYLKFISPYKEKSHE